MKHTLLGLTTELTTKNIRQNQAKVCVRERERKKEREGHRKREDDRKAMSERDIMRDGENDR